MGWIEYNTQTVAAFMLDKVREIITTCHAKDCNSRRLCDCCLRCAEHCLCDDSCSSEFFDYDY